MSWTSLFDWALLETTLPLKKRNSFNTYWWEGLAGIRRRQVPRAVWESSMPDIRSTMRPPSEDRLHVVWYYNAASNHIIHRWS